MQTYPMHFIARHYTTIQYIIGVFWRRPEASKTNLEQGSNCFIINIDLSRINLPNPMITYYVIDATHILIAISISVYMSRMV